MEKIALFGMRTAAILLALGFTLWAVQATADYYSTNLAAEHQHSPALQGFDTSYLQTNYWTSHGQGHHRNDAFMTVFDREYDGHTAIERGYGCGRYWTVTDTFGGHSGQRAVPCNLDKHQTGELQPRGDHVVYGAWSIH